VTDDSQSGRVAAAFAIANGDPDKIANTNEGSRGLRTPSFRVSLSLRAILLNKCYVLLHIAENHVEPQESGQHCVIVSAVRQ
jgi:hypothetical protein